MSSSPLHLSSVDLLAFRGIERTLTLSLGRRLTIIYGGNATGKSSVAQAIEFGLTGQVRDQEDGLIPAQYLANTRASGHGRVNLTLDDGTVLTAVTERPRAEIERAFREAAAVDWPDRQPLPITTTHITTQGMLARVLGTDNAVTRNDLSGLCAGAHLRRLVSRADQLATHSRQASAGRNIQGEIRDARAAYDTAKLLYDSLAAAGPIADLSATLVETRLNEVNQQLSLPEPTPIDTALARAETQIDDLRRRLQTLQGLLSRTRELGQHEAELDGLREQMDQAAAIEGALRERRTDAIAASMQAADQLKALTTKRGLLIDAVAAHERHLQAVSVIAGLDDRVREAASAQERVKQDLVILKADLDLARVGLVGHSAKLGQLKQDRQTAEMRRRTIDKSLLDIAALAPEDTDLLVRLEALRDSVPHLQESLQLSSRELEVARRNEAAVASRVGEDSRSSERALTAITELRALADDGRCPMCGHDHGSIEVLRRAIEQMTAALLTGTDALRSQFEQAAAGRQILETREAQLSAIVAQTRAEIAHIAATIDKQASARAVAMAEIDQNLNLAGIAIAPAIDALKRLRADVEVHLAGIEQDLRDATVAEREDEGTRSALERAIAAKSSELEQLERLTTELVDQIDRARGSLGAGTPAEQIAKNKAELAEIDPRVVRLEHEEGQARANLLELDRALGEKRSEIAGASRRRGVVEAFLASLDAELTRVGASRDLSTVVALEQNARESLDALLLLKAKATDVKHQLRSLDEGRAVTEARVHLGAAEQTLKALQDRQRRLHQRSEEFQNLHAQLEGLQNSTAEVVLENVRQPVAILFQAMTAGCPWDIEFKLEDGEVHAVLTDGSSRDLAATSVLNSAYVNVAAIALRLALASQQRWTRLRTVVLDDPILEMDPLTQSALIDGLEALLSSAFSPWQDLQFVLTTWSEDFAVMAAHKLAHLNIAPSPEVAGGSLEDAFVIHRLNSDPDGTIVSQRHVPRWRGQATAA